MQEHSHMKSDLPPGPQDSFLGMSFVRRFQRDPLEFTLGLARDYGDIVSYRMGPIRACQLNQPELIHELLVTKARHFSKEKRSLRILSQVDGNGLVITEGEVWLRQRRLLQPAFHARRMGRYAETIVARTVQKIGRWQPGQSLNIVDEMTHLTLEIIAKLFYDVELTGSAARLGEAVRVLSEVFYRELLTPFRLPDWLPLPGQARKRWAIATLDNLIRSSIRERRASGDDRGDLLSMLLLAVDDEGDGTGMSDEQARDEAVTMFNAGHDSTAAALAWIWYLIAMHPQVESRLIEEADRVLVNRIATADDLPNLQFTSMVVREALRLYPPVWALFVRVAQSNVELGGYHFPKGTFFYVFPWVLHRLPHLFQNPDAFDPDRFSPERVGDIPHDAWIPFGAGPHICIGMSLALNEMTLIVASILQKWRLILAPEQGPVVPEPLLALRPKGGLQMLVRPRTAVDEGTGNSVAGVVSSK